jgi:hypothetical protein
MLKAIKTAVDALTFERYSATTPACSRFPIHGVVAALSSLDAPESGWIPKKLPRGRDQPVCL